MQRLWLPAAVAVAFLLRLALLPLASAEPVGDPSHYLDTARNLLAGHGFVRVEPHFVKWAWYPPLYPMLLASVGLVAPLSPLTILLLNFTVELAIAGSILWLSSTLNIRGAWAAGLYLLWPTAIFMAPVANKEVLSTLLVCLMVVAWLRREPVSFGVIAGLSALAQPALALLPFFLVLSLRFPGWLRAAMVSAGVAVLVMLPWWVRNWLLFDQFVPLTTSSGAGLWVGSMGDGIKWHPYPPQYMTNEIELGRALAADAWQRISSAPVDYLLLTLRKASSLFTGDIWGAKPLAWMNPDYRPSPILAELTRVLSATVMMMALAFSLYRPTPLAKAVRACFLYLLTVVVWFQFSERHHYFVGPLAILLVVTELRRILGDAVKAARRVQVGVFRRKPVG